MTKKGGALLRPLAHYWFRGPASRDRDVIVMDGRRAEVYQPEDHPHIGLHLAKVKTPDDAVAFVERYGLLSEPKSPTILREPCPAEDVREPFANFEAAADELRRTLRTMGLVRAAGKGDRQALDRLRQEFAPDQDPFIDPMSGQPFPRYFETDDRTLLIRVSGWTAMLLEHRLKSTTHLYVFEPAARFNDPSIPPGGLRVGVIGPALLDYCYLSVATALAAEPLAICEDCQCAFVVEDGRQKFCDAACANRARFRRYKQRKEEAATKAAKTKTPTKTTKTPRSKTNNRTTKGSKHGKTTRTR